MTAGSSVLNKIGKGSGLLEVLFCWFVESGQLRRKRTYPDTLAMNGCWRRGTQWDSMEQEVNSLYFQDPCGGTPSPLLGTCLLTILEKHSLTQPGERFDSLDAHDYRGLGVQLPERSKQTAPSSVHHSTQGH